MNIRVDLSTPIYDGREVVFRSPVDCSQVTGLLLYYPGTDGNASSKEFAFADAHGNNVGDIDHLFAENAVVKVILDLETNMAFVQNADTNAYLEGRLAECVTHTKQTLTPEQKAKARANIGAVEINDTAVGADAWSSKNIVDKLCPTFTESGSVVTCEPVEGYPLEVEWQTKNIMQNTATTQTTNGLTFTANNDGSVTVNGTCTEYTQVVIGRAPYKKGVSYVLTGCPKGVGSQCSIFTYINLSTVKHDNGNGIEFEITDDEYTSNIRIQVYAGAILENAVFYPMVRLKSVADATYEPYAETATITRYGKNLLTTSMVENPEKDTSKTIFNGSLKAPFTISCDFSQATLVGASGAGFLTATIDGADQNLSWNMLKDTVIKTSGTLTRVKLVNWCNVTGIVKMQLEVGSVATAFEPYKTKATCVSGESVPAVAGINTLMADKGTFTVTGKADPVAIINKLTNAVLAMGSNV